MSNQILLLSMLIVPWLTLFFMKKESIKRYMPAAIFATATAILISDIGVRLGIWVIKETLYPLSQVLPHYYGTMPVLTMWVLRFTYERFGVYMITNLILDIGFNFFLLNTFFPSRGIIDFNISPLRALPITLVHAVAIYGYQMWQENISVRSEKPKLTPNLQPAAAKPLDNDQDGGAEK